VQTTARISHRCLKPSAASELGTAAGAALPVALIVSLVLDMSISLSLEQTLRRQAIRPLLDDLTFRLSPARSGASFAAVPAWVCSP
jgi:hypothetical protein